MFLHSTQLPVHKGPVCVDGPIENCKCVNCDMMKKEKPGRTKQKRQLVTDAKLRYVYVHCIPNNMVSSGYARKDVRKLYQRFLSISLLRAHRGVLLWSIKG